MRPLPHSAHRQFVETEKWERKGTSRGTTKIGDHFRYFLTLADGRRLTTWVSHGPGQIDDLNLVAHILRDQLEVSEDDFWACVNDGTLPPRPAPTTPQGSGEKLDYKLVRNLISKVGLTEDEVRKLPRDEAIRRRTDYLAGL